MQCPHMMPTSNVPNSPTPHPALENANGPASKPEPKEAFIKFAADLMSLEIKNTGSVKLIDGKIYFVVVNFFVRCVIQNFLVLWNTYVNKVL